MNHNNTINYYNQNSKSLVKRYEGADVTNIHNLLLKTFTNKKKLLEIGCGSGRDAFFMFKNGFNVTAIDGSMQMIKEAKKIHSEMENNFLTMLIPYDLKFNTKFDGIYSIATLMHLKLNDLKITLIKIFDLLKQNGKFLMSVSLYRDDVDENGYDDKGRFFLLMSKNMWIDICKEVGFKIENINTNKDGLNRDGIEWLTLTMIKN